MEMAIGKMGTISNIVFQYAKLKMLSFHYDCIDKFIDRSDFELCEMDTDSLYFALSTPRLEDAVKFEKRKEFFENYSSWFPAQACEEHKQDFITCKMTGQEWQTQNPCCLKSF